MRIISLYLPQFHRIPENDQWWGSGFTEWTNVKKSKPLYQGHLQPRIPLNDEYYDLSDTGVLIDQMKQALSYGIDGFCFYHYWFGNGRKLLEKPLENLLFEKKLPLEFMLCWANEPWTRTWDGDRGAKEVLVSQEYGTEDEWVLHYEYLSMFFERSEYIKIKNKPVICVYNSSDIACRRNMFKCWDTQAKKSGFSGIYIINAVRKPAMNEIPIIGDAIFDFEPFFTIGCIKEKMESISHRRKALYGNENIIIYDYEKFCQYMTRRMAIKDTYHNLGFFVGWDNSPRVGRNVKLIFENNSPQVFERFFRLQYRKSIELKNEFIFINAWNEWGEGTFLQADIEYGYGYLNAIKRVVRENYGGGENG